MSRTIKFRGAPLTLVGRNLKIGSPAPDFRVIATDLKDIWLGGFKSKIKVITFFPSLDTPVCDGQVKEFNIRAAGLSSDVTVLGISKDLPFAQKRFCSTFDINTITLFSDYRYSSFGINYGVLIKELNLLARGVFILDKNDILRHVQITEELTSPLDYGAAITALEELIKNPSSIAESQLPSKCKPCEIGSPPLPKERIEQLLLQAKGWELVDDKKIVKEFKFKDFTEAKYFLDLVSVIAEGQGHHPTLTLTYNKLKVTLTTHAAGGLTDNDFIMAGIIDEL
ncbi:MAG: thiol peroxidase [Candidatus Omnitrophota bacterium]